MNDFVEVLDSGLITLRGEETLARPFDSQSLIETKGWVSIVCRERGKIVARREGHNIWTNTGREYLAMMMSYRSNGSSSYRDDRLAYIGIGSGLQEESPNVVGLVDPVEYRSGIFLAGLAHSATEFPLTPSRTTVQYSVVFSESDLTFGGTTSVDISELGLFTNGHQTTFATWQRATAFGTSGATAKAQSPVAYKALVESVRKTNGIELQLDWQIRF